MYYSIHILQDALAGLTYELCCGADERRFSRVDLLPRAPALVHEDCLYVSLLSRALDFRAQGGTAFVLCLRDRFKDDGEQSLSDMIVVSENISLDELFSKVQESFLQLNEWIDNMHRVLVNDGDFQELLNLSEEMLGNTINISDSALTLLACTRGIPTDDESSLLLRQYGYHPESSIARFRKNRSFQRWQLLAITSRFVRPTAATATRPFGVSSAGKRVHTLSILSCSATTKHILRHCTTFSVSWWIMWRSA